MRDYRLHTHLLNLHVHTWEELLGWSTELDLLVYPERHVHFLSVSSMCAQPRLHVHALHAIGQLQYTQYVDQFA